MYVVSTYEDEWCFSKKCQHLDNTAFPRVRGRPTERGSVNGKSDAAAAARVRAFRPENPC